MKSKKVSIWASALLISCSLWTELQGQSLDPELIMLIDRAKTKSHAIKINDLSIEQNKLDAQMAKNTFLPKFSVSGSYTRLDQDIRFDSNLEQLLTGTEKLLIKEAKGVPFNTALPAGVPTSEIPALLDRNVFKSAVDMDWVLFSGTKVSNALKATQHKEKALQYANTKEENGLVMKIIDTYDKLGLVVASEKVLNSSEAYLKEQEKFVNGAVENGLATPLDRRKVALARHQLETKRVGVQNNKSLLLAALEQLTGENLATLTGLEPRIEKMYVDMQAEDSRRSELLALEEVIKATDYQIKMEKSQYIPAVAARGHYEILKNDLSLLDPNWYVGVGVKWNLFDGNEARNKARKATAEKMKYEQQLLEAEEMIALSQTKAKLSLASANKKIEMNEEEVSLTRQMYEFVDKQYRNGLTTVTEVVEALNDVEKAEFNLYTAYYEQRKAGVDLMQAKGLLQTISQ
ncbi:TolC family protein [Dyadobacter tibetensis]|uniref:TolC family protein n=1 Tax=Dyadobacter tibetensis TaxID=1211851 RepID=UPI0004726759|nr:TolC family protein [Dyadobacter tibetensis]